jgi:hypothetical protein
MPKIFTVFFLLVLGSVLSGCLTLNKPQDQPQTVSEQQKEFSQIANAIKSGKGTYCQFTQTIDGKDRVMQYWMMGKKIKVNGLASQTEAANQYSYMINDGKNIYLWSDNNIGVQWKVATDSAQIAQDNKFETEVPDFGDENNLEDYKAQGYRVDCQEKDLKDSDFVAPESVKFQNMEQVFNNAFGQYKQEMLKNQTDEPEAKPETEDQEKAFQQYQLMMQQNQQ